MTDEQKLKLLKAKKKRIQELRAEMEKLNKRITEIAVEMDDILEEVRDIAETK